MGKRKLIIKMDKSSGC